MPLDRGEMVVRGLSSRPMREVKRWMKDDLADADERDAVFVKGYLERHRANMGRLFEFGGVGIAIFAAYSIAMAQMGMSIDLIAPTLGLGAALIAFTLAIWVLGLLYDDRLDQVENKLTERVDAIPAPVPTIVASSVVQLGRWHLIRRD